MKFLELCVVNFNPTLLLTEFSVFKNTKRADCSKCPINVNNKTAFNCDKLPLDKKYYFARFHIRQKTSMLEVTQILFQSFHPQKPEGLLG